ncbi:TIGR04141 family sporadically distributed protein [Pseudomonas putida]|uniref:TIGR04141 family sporadically distributed protein n=1 Tax=Pseudomonas putida TaxID=303 RepID=UPI00226EB43F|nr:TIGR04141 family sporadically distributed protein [Pseudomonas putida]WAB97837.1 TIGR04141 family sporadically distributed protein [Pseudomonas putida]
MSMKEPRQKRESQKISIYSIKKPSEFDVDSIIRKGFLKVFEGENKVVLLLKDKKATPSWSKQLNKEFGISEVSNVSNSFMLLQNRGSELYAVCGGYAFKYLKDLYHDDFGLEVAVRLITDADSITSFHQRALSGAVKQLYYSVKGYNPNFDTENYSRMLRFVEGESKFEGRKYKVSGRSSLVIRTERGLRQIEDVIADIEDVLSGEPKIKFPRTFKQVSDLALKARLDADFTSELAEFLRVPGGETTISLELDDFIKQNSCENFKANFNGKSIVLSSLDIDELKDKLHSKIDAANLDADNLLKINFTAKNEDGESILEREPIEKICVYEQSVDGQSFIRLGGRWLEILDDIQSYIDEEIHQIEVRRGILPDWNKQVHKEEGEYNDFAAREKGFLCTDADFVYLKGGQNKLELADMFDKASKTFYHVKNTWGSKSSYFFSQASVAIETFKKSALFRENIRKKWPDEFPATFKLGKSIVVIAFAIAEDKHAGFPGNLSYFTKLSLVNNINKMIQCNVQVVLTPIKLIA